MQNVDSSVSENKFPSFHFLQTTNLKFRNFQEGLGVRATVSEIVKPHHLYFSDETSFSLFPSCPWSHVPLHALAFSAFSAFAFLFFVLYSLVQQIPSLRLFLLPFFATNMTTNKDALSKRNAVAQPCQLYFLGQNNLGLIEELPFDFSQHSQIRIGQQNPKIRKAPQDFFE